MQEDFKVSITGDISGLKKAVGDAEKELSAFASKSQSLKSAIAENIAISRGYDQAINELKKSFRSGAISQTQFKEALVRLKRDEKETAIETTKLKNELIDLNRAGAGLAKSTPQLGAGLGVVNKQGSHATNTMMEFSRVVQDAPYGIRGVANNIQQLVGNFGYLSKSAGGAGAAFKAMASSLMGPAGILLAVSLVTSLLVQYGDQIANIGSKSADLAKENEALAKSFETSNSILEAEIGALDAQLEIMELQKVSTKELLALKLKLLTESHQALVNQQFALETQLKNTMRFGYTQEQALNESSVKQTYLDYFIQVDRNTRDIEIYTHALKDFPYHELNNQHDISHEVIAKIISLISKGLVIEND